MINKLPFDYTIRRSARATKVRIIVTANKIEVVAPVNATEKQLHQFVVAQQQWIMSTVAKIIKRQLPPVNPISYSAGSSIVYQGKSYLLKLRATASTHINIEFANVFFVAFVPHHLMTINHSEAIKLALIDWMKKQLLRQVTHWVKFHAHKHQLFPRAINIKDLKSRWGSCGINNDIQINTLLIMAPPSVLEYVVVHELCHIQIRNHSPQFWELVAEHLPDYQQPHHWLKQHGNRLMQGF